MSDRTPRKATDTRPPQMGDLSDPLTAPVWPPALPGGSASAVLTDLRESAPASPATDVRPRYQVTVTITTVNGACADATVSATGSVGQVIASVDGALQGFRQEAER